MINFWTVGLIIFGYVFVFIQFKLYDGDVDWKKYAQSEKKKNDESGEFIEKRTPIDATPTPTVQNNAPPPSYEEINLDNCKV